MGFDMEAMYPNFWAVKTKGFPNENNNLSGPSEERNMLQQCQSTIDLTVQENKKRELRKKALQKSNSNRSLNDSSLLLNQQHVRRPSVPVSSTSSSHVHRIQERSTKRLQIKKTNEKSMNFPLSGKVNSVKLDPLEIASSPGNTPENSRSMELKSCSSSNKNNNDTKKDTSITKYSSVDLLSFDKLKKEVKINNTLNKKLHNKELLSSLKPKSITYLKEQNVPDKKPLSTPKNELPLETKEKKEKLEISGLFLTEVDSSLQETHHQIIASNLVDGMFHFKVKYNLKEAIKYFSQALKYANEIEEFSVVSLMYHKIGNVYKELKEYKESIKMQMKCIEIAKDINDIRLQGRGIKGIGLAYFGLEDYSKSLEYQKQAYEIAQSQQDIDLERRCLANIGNIFRFLQEYKKSIECHEKDLSLSSQINSISGLARAHQNLALSYEAIGENNKAEEHRVLYDKYIHNAEFQDIQNHSNDVFGNIIYQITQPKQDILNRVDIEIQKQLAEHSRNNQ